MDADIARGPCGAHSCINGGQRLKQKGGREPARDARVATRTQMRMRVEHFAVWAVIRCVGRHLPFQPHAERLNYHFGVAAARKLE